MAVVVKKFRVRAGGKTYSAGDIITLSKEEEKRLVKGGYCDYVAEVELNTEEDEDNKKTAAERDDESTKDDNEDNEKTDKEDAPDTGHPLENAVKPPKKTGKK